MMNLHRLSHERRARAEVPATLEAGNSKAGAKFRPIRLRVALAPQRAALSVIPDRRRFCGGDIVFAMSFARVLAPMRGKDAWRFARPSPSPPANRSKS